MSKTLKILAVVVIISVISISLFYLYRFRPVRVKHHHPLIAIYPTHVNGHDPVNNTEQFLLDLDLVKSLGFEGVRLHQKDYEEYGYGRVADDLNDRDLKFVMVLHSWDDSQFPQNENYVNQTIAYFTNIAEQLKNKCNLLWYALDYPYDWKRPSTQLDDPNYSFQLQRIINAIWNTDWHHSTYLVSGMIEATNRTPLTDFDHVDGFGIMPYSREGLVDKIDVERIQWIDKYKATRKKVYIAEWGVQTIENSPNRTYDYGLATNESMKVKMIREFIDYICDWDIYWDYFGSHDFPPENSDWGIVYNNNILKPSGEAMREVLRLACAELSQFSRGPDGWSFATSAWIFCKRWNHFEHHRCLSWRK